MQCTDMETYACHCLHFYGVGTTELLLVQVRCSSLYMWYSISQWLTWRSCVYNHKHIQRGTAYMVRLLVSGPFLTVSFVLVHLEISKHRDSVPCFQLIVLLGGGDSRPHLAAVALVCCSGSGRQVVASSMEHNSRNAHLRNYTVGNILLQLYESHRVHKKGTLRSSTCRRPP